MTMVIPDLDARERALLAAASRRARGLSVIMPADKAKIAKLERLNLIELKDQREIVQGQTKAVLVTELGRQVLQWLAAYHGEPS